MPDDSTDDPSAIATSADFDADGALSRDFLLRRGRCCHEGCRNCPYGYVARRDPNSVDHETE